MDVCKTYQVFADFDCVLEDGPDDGFVAFRSGQWAEVPVVVVKVNSNQEIIQWNSTDVDSIGWGEKHFYVFI